MLWFFCIPTEEMKDPDRFQYILCYGSSINFNSTSLRISTFQYILCYGSSVPAPTMPSTPGAFQYILCYGSSE